MTAFTHTVGGIPLLPANPGAIDPAFNSWVTLVKKGAAPLYNQYWPNPYLLDVLVQGATALTTGSTTIDLVLKSMDNAWDAGRI